MNLKNDKAPILNIFNSSIKNHELSSQYFLDWLLVNFQPDNLYWECIPQDGFNFHNQIEHKFSFSKLSTLSNIATFKKQGNVINYDFFSNLNFENTFFIRLEAKRIPHP